MKANRDQNGTYRRPTSSTGSRDKALVRARAKPPKADDNFCRTRNEWVRKSFFLLWQRLRASRGTIATYNLCQRGGRCSHFTHIYNRHFWKCSFSAWLSTKIVTSWSQKVVGQATWLAHWWQKVGGQLPALPNRLRRQCRIPYHTDGKRSISAQDNIGLNWN